MVTLTEKEADAVSLLEGTMVAMLITARHLVRQFDKYKDDLPAETRHFMQGTREMLQDWAATSYAMCEGPHDKLAVWSHPEALERYCQECAALFAKCPTCGGTLRIDQAIQLQTGNYHECCAPTSNLF